MAYFTTDRLLLIPITMRIKDNIRVPKAIFKNRGREVSRVVADEVASGVILWAWFLMSNVCEPKTLTERGKATAKAKIRPTVNKRLVSTGKDLKWVRYLFNYVVLL